MFQRAKGDNINGDPLTNPEKHYAISESTSEEQLNRRADLEIDNILNSFGDILSISKIHTNTSDGGDSGDSSGNDKYAVAQEAYRAQARAASLIKGVEGLLTMVSNIKRAYLLNDTGALAKMTEERKGVLDENCGSTKKCVEEMSLALDLAVHDLEMVYYGSKFGNSSY